MDYCLTFICCKMVSLSLKRPGMSHQKFFIAIAHNAEIKVTDWMFQVTWLVSSNQRASFQRRVDMLPLYAFMTSGPGIGHKKSFTFLLNFLVAWSLPATEKVFFIIVPVFDVVTVVVVVGEGKGACDERGIDVLHLQCDHSNKVL